MAGAREDDQAGLRQRRDEPLGELDELLVALAHDDRRRQVERGEPVPERFHRAGADSAQRRGDLCGLAAQDVFALASRRLGRGPGEEQLVLPAAREGGDTLELGELCERLVGGAALCALGLVLDPRGRGDERQVGDAFGCGERDVLRDPAAHRVAAKREAAGSGVEDVADAALEPAAPAEVEGDGPIAFAQLRDHGVPRVARSGEAVQEDDGLGHSPIMSETHDTYTLLRAFTDELVRCSVTVACTSPGSRSTPIVLSVARQPGLSSFSHVDERSAAFFAVGAAKATGVPAVVTCTSGTAAANYLPAIVEAHDARVPLIVVTADRPPELRDNGAGQAIDQIKLYGRFAKWFVEVGQHEATPERLRWIRGLAARAVQTATSGRPGVVHLNWPLREPLVLSDELGPLDDAGPPRALLAGTRRRAGRAGRARA